MVWPKDYKKKDIWQRCFKAAVRIIKLVRKIPYSIEGKEISKQVIRSAMSVVANLTEASSGYSYKDFKSSLNIARKEACETDCWLRMLYSVDLGNKEEIVYLGREYQEIIKILSAIVFSKKR